MLRFIAIAFIALCGAAAERLYQVSGRVESFGMASVTLHAVSSPLTVSLLTDRSGNFNFKKIPAGSYTFSVLVPGRGEARRTVDIGPSQADNRGRVKLAVDFKESEFGVRDAVERRHAVSAKELTIPSEAIREFNQAQKELAKPDVNAAIERLERAVELVPQFSVAWNNLGTIAYQTRNYQRAEECFRKALEADPASYQPLVNLGGVLINLGRMDEALDYNTHAALIRPTDALANSQLGMTYFMLGYFDYAVKYLETARRLDPGHFSHPQLYLGEIHMRRGEPAKAADALADFIQAHPDYPQAVKVRETIDKLRR